MSCFSPLWAEPYPSTSPKYGQYKIIPVKRWNIEPLEYATDINTGEYLKWIRIPCGKCVGCRLDYSRAWASRIIMESMDYPDNSLFVTLTYSDDFIPLKLADGSDEVVRGVELGKKYDIKGATLVKKDSQDFWKRLRRSIKYNYNSPMKVRYFCAGEYGSQTHRPHLHACVFGVPDDLEKIGKNKLGNTLYRSGLIEEAWGQGHVTIGKLNFQTAAYTARYTLKKAQGEDHEYNDRLGIAREFVTMSRKPGLGANYYEKHKDEIYKNDEIILPASSKDKPNVVKPPRYFDILYKADNPLEYARMKAQRGEVAEIARENLLAELKERELDEVAYLEISESAKTEQIKKLVRGDCNE